MQNLSSDDPVSEGLSTSQSINSITIQSEFNNQDNHISERVRSGDPVEEDSNIVKSEIDDQEGNEDQCKFDEFIENIRQCTSEINKTLHDIDEIGLTYSVEDFTTELPDMHMTWASMTTYTAAAISPTATKELSLESSYSSPAVIISNYGRFINDQCTRTQTTINGAYHMR